MRVVPSRPVSLAGAGLFFIPGDQLGLALQPGMDGIMAQVEKERAILVPLDELDSFEVAPVDEILFAGQTFLDLSVEVIGMKVAAAADAAVFRDNRFVKAVPAGARFLRAVVGITGEVPLADDTCGVAGPLEHLGDSDMLRRKVVRSVWTKVIGNSHSCRILPRHQRRPVG
ncbi:hypothetical protein ES703_102761 [subsurface metagenome]